jgi:predicted GNAT family N-acyltransferase
VLSSRWSAAAALYLVPECQGHGLGMRILQALMEKAIEQDARLLTLNARVAKMQFYQKFGFKPVGEVFASTKTGVPHIKMQKAV